MKNNIFVYLLVITSVLWSVGCTEDEPEQDDLLINTSHLEHLYQEIEVDGQMLGTVWIYCDAPDYELVTDDDEGFTCVDDVSRALVFYARAYRNTHKEEYLPKIENLSRFIFHMQAYNNYFYNFMFPNEDINTLHPNSVASANFWSWRAFWALSEVMLIEDNVLDETKTKAVQISDKLVTNITNLFVNPSITETYDGISIPSYAAQYGGDQISVMLIALSNYYQNNNSTEIAAIIDKLGNILLETQYGDENSFPYFSFLSWKNNWHGWGNLQSYALLCAGDITDNPVFTKSALNEIDYFYPYVQSQNYLNSYTLIAMADTTVGANKQQFPQISYEIRAMIFGAIKAFEITQDDKYAVMAGELGSWYFGNNPANQTMYDTITGRSYDGIDSPGSVNFNSGAESTIETLLSLQAIQSTEKAYQSLQKFISQ